MFKEDREDVIDNHWFEQPSTSHTEGNVTRVRDLLNSDRRVSVRMIVQTFSSQVDIVHTNNNKRSQYARVLHQGGSQSVEERALEINRVTNLYDHSESIQIES